MKQTDKRKKRRIISAVFAAVLAFAFLLSGTAFADAPFTDDLGNYVEWWNFRNTQTNNAVTDRAVPLSDQEAWGRWAKQFKTSSSTTQTEIMRTPTPPIVVNHKLYVGAGNKVYELDRETGETLRESEEMPGDVGYAMQSPVYADGKIFIAITLGRICAINLSDMKVAWTTDNSGIVKGQTVSPISYIKTGGKGYVYTGTWTGGTDSNGDLICATTDDENVTENESGAKIKPLKWHFNPQIVDAQNLAENNSVAKGYYWTGAYVTENYLAIGSDNGSVMGDEVNDTAFYTVNPLTGEIIDAVYGIKGQVRSTAVYHNGCLYFSTKGAKVYKIPVTEEGDLGEASFIDLMSYGAKMTTSTTVVYGGRIYLGVQGNGNQFSADGQHGFCVIRDDEELSDSSFLYNIPVPGYPQAGALLSTAYENEDFDGNGEADGRVYLFFTYNALPGGIFYTYDAPGQTQPTALSAEESKIFVPTKSQQQFCISSIAMDEQGTLYYKNDSGNLFAVETNPAALLEMKVLEENGEELTLDQAFQPKLPEYYTTASSDAEKVLLQMTPAEGVSVRVNGEAYTVGTSMPVSLSGEEETVISIQTSKNGQSREYSVFVNRASTNANLKALASTTTNSIPASTNTRPVTPDFDPTITEYTFDWITTGTGTSSDPATKKMMNLVLGTENAKAKVKVLPGENVDTSGGKVKSDGTLQNYTMQGSALYTLRFPVYSMDVTHDSTVTVFVTAEDGETTKEYHVTFSRRIYVTEVQISEDVLEMEEGDDSHTLSATAFPDYATDCTIKWTSSDETVVTVDEMTGKITAVGPGTALITAHSADEAYAQCEVTVLANHKTVQKEAAPATLEEEGYVRDCWRCEICGRCFEEEEGETEIPREEIVIPKLIDISGASVKVSDQTFNKKEQKPEPVVTMDEKPLTKDVDYTLSYENNKNAGTATVILQGTGIYGGEKTASFTIKKAKSPMTVKAKKVSARAKKKVSIKASKAFTVKKAAGKVTYKQITKNAKIKVASNGKVTVKKGLKKGKTIRIKVRVTDPGSMNYKKSAKTVTLKVKIK